MRMNVTLVKCNTANNILLDNDVLKPTVGLKDIII